MSDLTLGPYTAGEKPAPITYQFLDDQGVPLALTGSWVAKLEQRNRSTGDTVTEATPTFDVPTATATFTVATTDPGVYTGELWIGDGSNRYASVRFAWLTRAAVGTAPSI